jgi:hypothetical protein
MTLFPNTSTRFSVMIIGNHIWAGLQIDTIAGLVPITRKTDLPQLSLAGISGCRFLVSVFEILHLQSSFLDRTSRDGMHIGNKMLKAKAGMRSSPFHL